MEGNKVQIMQKGSTSKQSNPTGCFLGFETCVHVTENLAQTMDLLF